jgi:hypothetical protein
MNKALGNYYTKLIQRKIKNMEDVPSDLKSYVSERLETTETPEPKEGETADPE